MRDASIVGLLVLMVIGCAGYVTTCAQKTREACEKTRQVMVGSQDQGVRAMAASACDRLP